MEFSQYTDAQIDQIYFDNIGYRPMAEGEMSRIETIEVLEQYFNECGVLTIPKF